MREHWNAKFPQILSHATTQRAASHKLIPSRYVTLCPRSPSTPLTLTLELRHTTALPISLTHSFSSTWCSQWLFRLHHWRKTVAPMTSPVCLLDWSFGKWNILVSGCRVAVIRFSSFQQFPLPSVAHRVDTARLTVSSAVVCTTTPTAVAAVVV